jgi:ABC-type lipoprotein release transport system permease subunit
VFDSQREGIQPIVWTPLDLTTFTGVAVLFAAVATLAALLPAHRATRVDPLVALRSQYSPNVRGHAG